MAVRLSVLIAIVFALSAPFQSAPPIAFATHTTSGTPTATPWPDGQGQYGVGMTSTPTPIGYSPYQPAPNQTYPTGTGQQSVSSGTSQQSVVSGTGQQSVTSPAYSEVPSPGLAPAPGGLPGNIAVPGAASPMPGGSDVCYGDELITFSPETPRIGNELLIAVTSAHPHPYGRLAGTEPTQFVRERFGQRGYVWEWTVQPSYPGNHEYTFFVDSTIPCQKIQLRVMQPLSTRTPTPTKTATPYNWNENSNENNNGNSNDNSTFVYPTSSAFAPAVNPSLYVVPGQDQYQCAAFESQSNAQRVLRYNPSDPNGLDAEDGSVDGVACMTWAYPYYPADRDVTPVARVTPTTVVTTVPTQTFTPTLTPTPTKVPFNPLNYLGQGDRYGCGDFESQAEAQMVLRLGPADPNRLDTNPRDGLACGGLEAAADGVPSGIMPLPHNTERVPRP